MKKHLLILALLLAFSGCNDKPEINPSNASSGLSNTYLRISPNPATNDATIGVSSSDNFTLFVFDTHGKAILEQSAEGGNNSYQFGISLAEKPKGTYHVILKTRTGTIKQNLLKL